MTDASPAAGSRVRQVSPEYEGTEVYHSLYLPTDWKPGGNYPILVEYTGNKFPPANGSGEAKASPEAPASLMKSRRFMVTPIQTNIF